jgi:hypothetical protein
MPTPSCVGRQAPARPEGCVNSIPPADRRIHAVSGPRQALFSDALSVRCEWRLRRPRPVLLDELLPLFLAERGDLLGAHVQLTDEDGYHPRLVFDWSLL